MKNLCKKNFFPLLGLEFFILLKKLPTNWVMQSRLLHLKNVYNFLQCFISAFSMKLCSLKDFFFNIFIFPLFCGFIYKENLYNVNRNPFQKKVNILFECQSCVQCLYFPPRSGFMKSSVFYFLSKVFKYCLYYICIHTPSF